MFVSYAPMSDAYVPRPDALASPGFMFMILELALCSASAELAAHPVFMVHEPRAPLSRGWLRVLHGVALGMAHVHACGILHRDLSTDNVLLTAPPADAACRALVADFGVAKEGRDAATIARGACRKYAPEALGMWRAFDRDRHYTLACDEPTSTDSDPV